MAGSIIGLENTVLNQAALKRSNENRLHCVGHNIEEKKWISSSKLRSERSKLKGTEEKEVKEGNEA